MGAYFAIGGALSLFVVALPNSTSVWVRVSDEMWGAVFELEMRYRRKLVTPDQAAF